MTEASPTPRTTLTALDYYQLYPADGGTVPLGLLIEEFILADDLSAVRLCGAGWTPADGGWWSSARFAHTLRADPRLRARVAAVDRAMAETVFQRLSGTALPDEPALRGYFRDDVVLVADPAWRLGIGSGVHRILFAGGVDGDRLAALQASLHADDGAADLDRGPGVVSAGKRRLDGTGFRWELRRVAGGVAWAIDLRSDPPGHTAPSGLLRHLIHTARRHGLIPVTIERLS